MQIECQVVIGIKWECAFIMPFCACDLNLKQFRSQLCAQKFAGFFFLGLPVRFTTRCMIKIFSNESYFIIHFALLFIKVGSLNAHTCRVICIFEMARDKKDAFHRFETFELF